MHPIKIKSIITGNTLFKGSFASLREALEQAVSEGADLTGANLVKAEIPGADLTGADLCHADLAGANLNGADLTDSDLTGAILVGTNLSDAILNNAILHRAVIFQANFDGAELENISGKPYAEEWPI